MKRSKRSLRKRYGHSLTGGGTYAGRYVHKISPRDTDTFGPIRLTDSDFRDRKTLGAALRKARVAIDRVNSFRYEGGGKYVVFPENRSVWHAIVLTRVGG